jgi:hypothetical protein
LGGADAGTELADGRRPSEDEIEVWNGFMTKWCWRDAGTQRLHERLAEIGLPLGTVQTMFEFIDLDEGRSKVQARRERPNAGASMPRPVNDRVGVYEKGVSPENLPRKMSSLAFLVRCDGEPELNTVGSVKKFSRVFR